MSKVTSRHCGHLPLFKTFLLYDRWQRKPQGWDDCNPTILILVTHILCSFLLFCWYGRIPVTSRGQPAPENLDWWAQVLQTLSLCKSDGPGLREMLSRHPQLPPRHGRSSRFCTATNQVRLGSFSVFYERQSEREVAQSCPILCDPMDCSLPGSSIHGILWARIREWVAISISRRSSQPRDWTRVSRFASTHFTVWVTREWKTKAKPTHMQKAFLSTRDLSEDFGEGRGQQARQQRKGHWKRDHPLSLPTLQPPGGRSLTHPWPHIRCLFSFSRSILIRNKTNKSGPLFLIKRFLHSEPFSPGRHPDSLPWRAWPQGDLRALTAMPGMLGPTAAIRRFSSPRLFHRLSGRITHCADCVCVRPKSLQLCPALLTPCQAPLSMGFFRQEHWSGLPRPPPGDRTVS